MIKFPPANMLHYEVHSMYYDPFFDSCPPKAATMGGTLLRYQGPITRKARISNTTAIPALHMVGKMGFHHMDFHH